MTKFAVVKRNDSVYGMIVDIYGHETFKSFEVKSFYNMMAGMDAQSITWFDDRDEALSFFRELGGYEFLAVTRDTNYPGPLHVLDSCPFDSKYFIKGEFKTIEECIDYCVEYIKTLDKLLEVSEY